MRVFSSLFLMTVAGMCLFIAGCGPAATGDEGEKREPPTSDEWRENKADFDQDRGDAASDISSAEDDADRAQDGPRRRRRSDAQSGRNRDRQPAVKPLVRKDDEEEKD